MEKRDNPRRLRKSDYVEEEEKEVKIETTGKSPPKTVRLVCILGTERKVALGPITGKRYEFFKNVPVEVDENDAEQMLQLKRGGCCGNLPTPIFVKE